MMHWCSCSQGNMAGPCSCGSFYSQTNSSSMLFSMPNHESFDETDMYPFASSSSSSVDCTLSLGTPSTRLCEDDEVRRIRHYGRSGSTSKASRGNNGHGSNSSGKGNDPLLARRCANCDTTSTPLWRNGPRGPKSLCNACGIRFKKEERRASAANANNPVAPASTLQQQHHGYYYHPNSSWVHQSQNQDMPCFSSVNEFGFV